MKGKKTVAANSEAQTGPWDYWIKWHLLSAELKGGSRGKGEEAFCPEAEERVLSGTRRDRVSVNQVPRASSMPILNPAA